MKTPCKKVLIVEDEPLILLDMADTLERAGFAVEGATTVGQALCRIEDGSIDGATLDINLRGSNASVVAAKLAERAIPYLICSAYPAEMVSDWARSAMRVEKPIEPRELVGTVSTMLFRSEK